MTLPLSKFIGFAIMACALLTACDGKKDGSGKTLTVGICADYAPFEFFKEGQIVGYDIDLMREIGKRLGKDVQFKDMSFDAILGSLTTSRIDAAISSITPTVERRKSIDFSKEYIHSSRVMLCKGTSSIETVDDLVDETVGVQNGSTHETYAKGPLSQEVRLSVKSLSKIPDLLQDMDAGRLSCLILGNAEAESILKSHKNLKTIALPGELSGVAIGLPKGSPLTEKINKVLDEMEADGYLAKLKETWQLPTP